MRVHTATSPLPTMTALGRNPTPSTSTTVLCPEKNMGTRKRAKWRTGLSLSNTWIKLVARRLAQQVKTRIRQTGSTAVYSPCNLPLQTQQSRPPRQTVQRTAAVVSPFRPIPLSMCVCVRVYFICACIYQIAHKTAQSCAVSLVILRYSHWFFQAVLLLRDQCARV